MSEFNFEITSWLNFLKVASIATSADYYSLPVRVKTPVSQHHRLFKSKSAELPVLENCRSILKENLFIESINDYWMASYQSNSQNLWRNTNANAKIPLLCMFLTLLKIFLEWWFLGSGVSTSLPAKSYNSEKEQGTLP